MKPNRFPHSLVLIFAMIFVAQIATYLLPAGAYERREDPVSHRLTVVAGTYQEIPDAEQLPWHATLTKIPQGMAEAQGIIFFVFIVGGVIAVVRATGAIDALIAAAIRHLGGKPILLVAGMTTLFAIGSSTIGMAEEYMPFIPLLVTMCLALKMDAVVAMGIVYLGAGVGYGCAAYNPFTVVIGQRIAEIKPPAGHGVRWILLAVCLVVAVHHIMRYAARIRRDPSRSLVGDVDYSQGYEMPSDVALTPGRGFILALFAAMIGVFVWGSKYRDWNLVELSGLFFGLALVAAVVGRLSPNRVAREFCSGAAEMTTTALLIGFARTIEQVLSDGQVIDTVIHAMAQPLQGAGPDIAAVGMFGVQSLCNLFIPSGSGQAYVTMPLMVPLADVTGVSRQVAVLAYQFGDGFTNTIMPTNALLMGMLALGKIPYERWLRFIVPFLLKVSAVAIVALILAVHLGFE